MSTWVVGDIHGCYNEFMELMKNPEIKAEDTIIIIGDIIDRGPDSLKMIKWAMENVTPDGRFQMILGNHENNIIEDYDNNRKLFRKYYPDEKFENMDVLVLGCHYGFDVYMSKEGCKLIKDVRPFISWFKKLPLTKRVTVTTPEGEEQEYIIAHGWYGKRWRRLDILWERDIDDFGKFKKDYVPEQNEIMIHGHTPVLIANRYPVDGCVFFREHSINIDCGCVYGVTEHYKGRLAALRLEDQKVIYQQPLRMLKSE